jgi:hypothetical protein
MGEANSTSFRHKSNLSENLLLRANMTSACIILSWGLVHLNKCWIMWAFKYLF